MASDEARRPADEKGRGRGKVSRRLTFRSPKREAVPATGTKDFDPRSGEDDGHDGHDGDAGDAGSAGVREPRHPKPPGPRADAGELPMPEQQYTVTLPDPRR
jgi:hypothetical protein